MSEYQYYEFAAVDKPLTTTQQQELRKLSTRAEITSTSFFNEYHWGDFKGDPRKLITKYFDVFLYYANWGTRWCMIRVPRDAVDLAAWRAFEVEDGIEIRAGKEFVVADICLEDETGDYDIPYDTSIDAVLPARDLLLEGDLGPLYVAWLACLEPGLVDDDVLEPCDVQNLRQLSSVTRSMAQFLVVNARLLKKAFDPAKGKATERLGRKQLAHWVGSLTPEVKDKLLVDLLGDAAASARPTILRRFRKDSLSKAAQSRKIQAPSGPRRMAGALLDAVGLRSEE